MTIWLVHGILVTRYLVLFINQVKYAREFLLCDLVVLQRTHAVLVIEPCQLIDLPSCTCATAPTETLDA